MDDEDGRGAGDLPPYRDVLVKRGGRTSLRGGALGSDFGSGTRTHTTEVTSNVYTSPCVLLYWLVGFGLLHVRA